MAPIFNWIFTWGGWWGSSAYEGCGGNNLETVQDMDMVVA